MSLGGLIATLLAALLDLQAVVAVAPFCDPAATLSLRPPVPSLRHLGMLGDDEASWGLDRASAGRMLHDTLAPLIARNLTPRTSGDRITLVRAMQDLVVGPDPVTELAEQWHTDLWTYPHGHITVMSAGGIARRITERATTAHGRLDPVRRDVTVTRTLLRREGAPAKDSLTSSDRPATTTRRAWRRSSTRLPRKGSSSSRFPASRRPSSRAHGSCRSCSKADSP